MIEQLPLTIEETRESLRAKKFSCRELVDAYLDRIEKIDSTLNSFITIEKENARDHADACDEHIARAGYPEDKPLFGIPFAVKDAICTEGIRSTASAKILDNYIPPFDATVIAKLKSAGGIILGKNNCDAFGHGASNENSQYGPVLNPWNTKMVAGGSSGGSAAAVSANFCAFSIAEDTGGSIRQPAAFCGLAGLRPSYGRNSRYGIMPMASSLDTVGPLARTVQDVALLMEVMAGKDKLDGTTVEDEVPAYSTHISKLSKKLRVGLPQEYFTGELEEEIKNIIEKAIEDIKNLGVQVSEVSLPHTKFAVPVYYIIVPAEDSSNLGRMDGIRYGVRAQTDNLFDTYAESRAQGFPTEVKRRIMIGTFSLSSGYYDAYYAHAQKVRTLIRQDFDKVFETVDLLLTPTTPAPAFPLGSKTQDPIAMYLADVFVSPAALAGLPALSVSAGFTKVGLPVGLQIIGPRLNELEVLQLGYAYEQINKWFLKQPSL
ncbi:MAG: Asp-tRNA(Asn)/Glu-tRNA(Gln) amidotransferase subunit GatA [Candidatus Magasanikbacteria bacterium]|nr:Asp-tRNA(Asn)/Glu-tRNA(Gln) amidotransferase subunit GatA [Candidatus Magasanikbacteria bacterium]